MRECRTDRAKDKRTSRSRLPREPPTYVDVGLLPAMVVAGKPLCRATRAIACFSVGLSPWHAESTISHGGRCGCPVQFTYRRRSSTTQGGTSMTFNGLVRRTSQVPRPREFDRPAFKLEGYRPMQIIFRRSRGTNFALTANDCFPAMPHICGAVGQNDVAKGFDMSGLPWAKIIQFTGPDRALEIAGVKLVGINAQNGSRLVFSLLFIAFVIIFALGALAGRAGVGGAAECACSFLAWTRHEPRDGSADDDWAGLDLVQ